VGDAWVVCPPRQALVRTGLWNNTVLLFTSDNGGNPMVGGQNYPYRCGPGARRVMSLDSLGLGVGPP
jgi:hypothetical protein